jgi:hypothetical protein
MAECLVKAISVTNIDPVKDIRGCYKSGDVVVVMPDGHLWGASEGLPNFWIVKVPGATVAQLEIYLDPVTAVDPPELGGRTRVIRRRRWFADISQLTGGSRNTLLATGVISVPLTTVQGFMTNKVP